MTTPSEDRFRALAEPLRRFLRSRVGDRDVAEDLLQEVFLRLHQQPLDAIERLDAWLFRVAGNVAIDHLRTSAGARGRAGCDPLDEHTEPQSEPQLIDDDHAARVLAAWLGARLAELPSHYREVLVLTEVEGLSQREAAARLGIPYSTLKSRVQRGRDLLHADLIRCCEVELDARKRVTDFRPRQQPCSCRDCPPRDE